MGDLAAEEARSSRLGANVPARIRELQAHSPRQADPPDFKKLLADLHVAALNRAKAESAVALDVLFRLAVLKFQRVELVNQYGLVLERCRARMKMYDGPRRLALPRPWNRVDASRNSRSIKRAYCAVPDRTSSTLLVTRERDPGQDPSLTVWRRRIPHL